MRENPEEPFEGDGDVASFDGEALHGKEASPLRPSPKRAGRPRKDSASECDGRFVGTRIPTDVYRRLYRAKARIEMETGCFYGIGRLLERALRRGLSRIEGELDRREFRDSDSSGQPARPADRGVADAGESNEGSEERSE